MSKNTYEQASAKILIVDDQERNLIAFERVLNGLEAEIIKANSGEQALQLVMEHEVAVVLLDVQMPGMDGFETAELMRKNHYTETIPIIFVTAINKEKVHVFTGYKMGAVDYLFKPVDPYVLQSKVQIFLDIYYQKTQRLVTAFRELQAARSELERSNKELAKLALHDALTDLPNRRQFEEELSRCVSYADRYNIEFAVLFLDLDNFKSINDNYGHAVGDDLLKLAGTKILSKLRQEDFLARLGGDEFAIILTRLKSHDNAGKVAESIVNLFKNEQSIEGNKFYVTTSIGIACYPFAGENRESLIKNADIAMYRAKAMGKNTYQYFSEQLNKEYTHRATVETALRQALSSQEFHMVYQVVYELATQKPVGVEALIRWHHPKLGDVSPVEFIPISEEVGIIQQIGAWIMQTACQQFADWCELGFNDIDYAINLSPRQLQQADLVEETKHVLSRYKINPKSLVLELTETAIMANMGEAEDMLKELHQMGIRISIDDFGTGYSSLIRLRHLPISALKIDRSFIRDVLSDKNDAIIVKAILSLANSLGLKAIAEGIETKEQLQFLIDNGCSYGQGFYLSKPVSADEVTNIFNKVKKNG
jgi:diguanylate cyclase (GGDEF)-like protein